MRHLTNDLTYEFVNLSSIHHLRTGTITIWNTNNGRMSNIVPLGKCMINAAYLTVTKSGHFPKNREESIKALKSSQILLVGDDPINIKLEEEEILIGAAPNGETSIGMFKG